MIFDKRKKPYLRQENEKYCDKRHEDRKTRINFIRNRNNIFKARGKIAVFRAIPEGISREAGIYKHVVLTGEQKRCIVLIEQNKNFVQFRGGRNRGTGVFRPFRHY